MNYMDDEKINDRKIWIKYLSKIAEPVLFNAANGTLKKNMEIEYIDEKKIQFSYLEAMGRLTCGIGPWLELGPENSEEGIIRKKYIDLLIKGIVNIFNPESDDFLLFEGFHQPLVDVAFLVQGIIRAKTQIWDNIPPYNQRLIIQILKKTRSITPYNNNWLLFASIIEAFFLDVLGECNENRLMHGVKMFMEKWYCGDGWYGDGKPYHFDYYNSFVIHPMLTDILIILKKHGLIENDLLNIQYDRLKHYSNHLERLISQDGTYPIVGRSMTYRTGIFHALAQSTLLGLYEDIKPSQVRAALTTVIQNQFSNENNFSDNGWLLLGLNGHQKDIAEPYINTGSLYLCSTIFLPLGLPDNDKFWSSPREEWTSVKGWNGKNINRSIHMDNITNFKIEKYNGKYQLNFVRDDDDNTLLSIYKTARIDLKNLGSENNSIEIIQNSDIESNEKYPSWFKDSQGYGITIESDKGEINLKIKCIGDGQLKIWLRGPDVRDKNDNRFPVFIDYTCCAINNKLIFEESKLVWHDKPFLIKKGVLNLDIINIHIKWSPFSKFSNYQR